MDKLGLFAVVSSCLLVACGSTPADREDEATQAIAHSLGSSPLGSGPFGGAQARKIKPAYTPTALSHKPVKVMLELEGDPITVLQSQQVERRLTSAEKELFRSRLRSMQRPLEAQVANLGGRVLRSFQNAYNGLSVQIPRDRLPGLSKLPGVVGVHEIRLMRRATTKAIPFVAAPAAWNGLAGVHGERVKVAILDTGIDYTHANFGGPGTVAAYEAAHANEASPAAPWLFGPKAPRIKGGTDLAGDAYDPESEDPEIATPHPDPNPLDCEGHGSHVAGIAAGSGVLPNGATYRGPYDAATHSREFRIGPGVAPKADLYAVRIFGCEGQTGLTVDAIEWAVDHDMDVINLSLGTPFGSPDAPDAIAARNAVRSGVVVVAAAGNSGNVPYLASSPASGEGVLSVAATDASPTLPGASLDLGEHSISALNANAATFADGTSYPVVVLGSPENVSFGCDAADYAGPDVRGALVVTLRGACDRWQRAILGQAAGAAAVAMLNADPGYPPFEGEIPGVTIPFFGIAQADGPALLAASTASAKASVLENPGFRGVASFSSGGPRFADSALKPNVIAPGVSVVSTAVGTGSGALTGSGTSMASPVVAGVAALTRQAHPSWSARDIANVISNTAAPSAINGYSTRLAGAGVPQAAAAVKAGAIASAERSPALNFGFVELRDRARLRGSITVANQERGAMQFNVSIPAPFVQGVPHVAIASKTRLRVPAGESATFNLELTVPLPNVDPLGFNDFAGVVELTPADANSNHGVTLRVPYYGVARPEANVDAELEPAPRPNKPQGQLELSNFRSKLPGTAGVYAWGIEGESDLKSCNDVRAVGVQSLTVGEEGPWLVFAFDGFRRCSNSAVNEYAILLENELGQQFALIGVDQGLLEVNDPNGVLVTAVFDVQTEDVYELPALAASDSATVQLAAPASLLGLTSAAPRFTYQAQTVNLAGQGEDDPAGEARFNAYASALLGLGQLVAVDGDARTKLPIGVDATEFALTPSKGVFVLSAENAPGPKQAELLPLRYFTR
ncbi:MAG TPA: S8 family serine peptidase [Polyangiaceae bacterium]|nr:S8 family serine peptidase [Polyangiaceae bacterium]